MSDTTILLILTGLLGLALGVLVGVLWMRRAARSELAAFEQSKMQAAAALHQQLFDAQADSRAGATRERDAAAELSRVTAERAALEARLSEAAGVAVRAEALQRERDALEQVRAALSGRVAELSAQLDAEKAKAEERLKLLEGAAERIRATFAQQAAETLGQTSAQLSEQHANVLGALLGPMREQLEAFRNALGETYAREHGERSALKQELEMLRGLNVQLGHEAQNLTRALKGDSRTQGAWGEMVLERVLEASGLERGRGYEPQAVMHDDEAARQRPDVIVHLPEGRDLVVDSKVALTAYERYCSAPGEAERMVHLAEHVQALRRHVVELAERGYAGLPGLKTLDFVLMFVPIEGAVSEAVRSDPEIYSFALARHVALVTPSTLLVTLRTVSHLWRMEDRNANAVEIAERAGRLYDVFVNVAHNLRKVRQQMQRTQDLLGDSLARVEGGRGNLVAKAEELRKLGAKARKRLPPDVVERALESDANGPVLEQVEDNDLFETDASAEPDETPSTAAEAQNAQ